MFWLLVVVNHLSILVVAVVVVGGGVSCGAVDIPIDVFDVAAGVVHFAVGCFL